MKKTLDDYKQSIMALPDTEHYTKEDLLTPAFLIDQDKQLEVYYAPHNEYINPDAKVFIVGITPGFEQMRIAIETARRGFLKENTLERLQYECKVAARFSGQLRKNMLTMLDEIGLNAYLNLKSCKQLFEERDDLLHTVSLIPYPVFLKGKNYTGHTPKLVKSDFLIQYVRQNFIQEVACLKHTEHMILIPLGKAVEETLEVLQKEGVLGDFKILKGFPHPSGANVNRLKQLAANKEAMRAVLAL